MTAGHTAWAAFLGGGVLPPPCVDSSCDQGGAAPPNVPGPPTTMLGLGSPLAAGRMPGAVLVLRRPPFTEQVSRLRQGVRGAWASGADIPDQDPALVLALPYATGVTAARSPGLPESRFPCL